MQTLLCALLTRNHRGRPIVDGVTLTMLLLARPQMGLTPLDIAVKEGHDDIADLLRQRGAREGQVRCHCLRGLCSSGIHTLPLLLGSD